MCIFCKIINREIPAEIIYEDNDVIAILDISQATKGHALIIPKKHYPDIFSLDYDISQKIMNITVKIAKHYQVVFPDMIGLNLINNNKEAAGQAVFHYHMHLIPRYHNDNLIHFKPTNNAHIYDIKEVSKLAKINK